MIMLLNKLAFSYRKYFYYLILILFTERNVMASPASEIVAATTTELTKSADKKESKEVFATIPELKEYTDTEILDKIILPLLTKHKEILWFADKNVAVTQEAPGQSQKAGWTQELVKLDLIKPFAGKYIELERMLSSIAFFHLLYEGTPAAYQKLTSVQKKEEQLSESAFKQLNQLARSVAKDKQSYYAVALMLIVSDLGKTPIATERAKQHRLVQLDHDDFIETLLSQSKDIITDIIPSFAEVPEDTQAFITKVASAMKVHLGHALHIEGGQRLFAKFEEAVLAGKISKEVLDFAFLIQLSDVAAAAAHVDKDGSLSLVNNPCVGYQLVGESLKLIQAGKTAKDALQWYLQARGEQLGISSFEPLNRVMIRLCCMMRLYSKAEGEVLLTAAAKLSIEDSLLLIEQFGLETKEIGINTWKRNPTYLPAVLLNLGKFQDQREPLLDKITRALEGAVCVARLCRQYASVPENVNSEHPLNFNSLAGLAISKPSLFSSEHFNPELFSFEKNSVTLKKIEPKPSPALTTRFEAVRDAAVSVAAADPLPIVSDNAQFKQ